MKTRSEEWLIEYQLPRHKVKTVRIPRSTILKCGSGAQAFEKKTKVSAAHVISFTVLNFDEKGNVISEDLHIVKKATKV